MDEKEASHFGAVDFSSDKTAPARPPAPPPESSENSVEMVNYMLSNNPPPQGQISLDKLSFADVMQFAEFGPKLSLQQSKAAEEESYFLKLHDDAPLLPPPALAAGEEDRDKNINVNAAAAGRYSSENASSSVLQLQLAEKAAGAADEQKNSSSSRRKRPRALKTSEEVESQRMTHIAVERNRRRQMNDHLRVLRSLMPGSYVQRGDQASIIGGAIEFVRELEQLLQCLESQKRRRLFGGSGEAPRAIMEGVAGGANLVIPNQQQQQQTPPPSAAFYPPLPFPTHHDQVKLLDVDVDAGGGLGEEMAENKSCLADVEVRLLGSDAMIKILSRRRPGQLIKMIAALEDLQFTILHTNVTTIEQTVLYSFSVKMGNETRGTAEGIANSVQQILSFIDTNSSV